MPPTSLALRGAFLAPDYLALLLFDRVVLDEESFERLLTRRHWSYNKVAELVRALSSEGLLRTENYAARLAPVQDAVAAQVERDLNSLDEWRPLLKTAVARWTEFIRLLRDDFRDVFEQSNDRYFAHSAAGDRVRFHVHELRYVMHDAHADILHLQFADHNDNLAREILRWYLTYVQSNISLAQSLGLPLYDWHDYQPFYERKLSSAAENSGEIQQVHKLFDVAFPEFSVESVSHLIKLLRDKRIEQLRSLVTAAVHGEVTFDRDFAVRTLFEVLSTELAIGRFRSVASYP